MMQLIYNLKLKNIMQKNKFEIAREIVDQYNEAYLQWDTMDHIQEWIDEQGKLENKKEYIHFDDDGHVIDVDKKHIDVCGSCWSQIKYQKISFSKSFISPLQKILDHVVDCKKWNWEHVNIINIKQLKLTHTEYWNLNRLANFGLLYRETDAEWNKIKHGTYWVPQKRIFDFLNWDWDVAQYYVVKSTTKQRILSKTRITIDELPEVDGWLDYKTKSMPWYINYILNDNIK